MIEGQIAGISNKHHPNVQVQTDKNTRNLDFFLSLINEKCKLCFSAIND